MSKKQEIDPDDQKLQMRLNALKNPRPLKVGPEQQHGVVQGWADNFVQELKAVEQVKVGGANPLPPSILELEDEELEQRKVKNAQVAAIEPEKAKDALPPAAAVEHIAPPLAYHPHAAERAQSAETYEQAMRSYREYGEQNKDQQFQTLESKGGVTIFIPPGMDPKSPEARLPENQVKYENGKYTWGKNTSGIEPPQDLGGGKWKMEQVELGGTRSIVAADANTLESRTAEQRAAHPEARMSVAEFMQQKYTAKGRAAKREKKVQANAGQVQGQKNQQQNVR